MKWWFKLNRNKIYRKFNFDPHNFILKKFKVDKSFKLIVSKKRYLIFKKKKFKIKKYMRFFYSYKKKYNFYRPKRRKIASFFKSKKSFKKRINLTKKIFGKWQLNFWNKIKLGYYIRKKGKRIRRSKRRLKKRFSIKYRRIRLKRRKIKKVRKTWSQTKVYLKSNKKKLYKKNVWLYIKNIRKKQKTWWLLRILLRKTAIHYGFKKLKKFRFINKFSDSALSIKSYRNDKLESMLNIFLIKLNIFDNIFISTNFIRVSCNVLIDFKKIYDPYRYVSINKIVSFNNIIQVQSFFKRRCFFGKHFFLKLNKKRKSISRSILVKIIINVPKYIHYDYQIMCFKIFRLPNKKEHYSKYKKLKDNWAINTRLQYN